jgi:Uma2 family endonuclease
MMGRHGEQDMLRESRTRLTPEEYLAIERAADHKSEYPDGEMLAMSGASVRHTIIAANVAGELWTQLRKTLYTVHMSALRVKVSPAGLYMYPDIVGGVR